MYKLCLHTPHAIELNNRVSIEGLSNPLRAGGSYTLTCNATADITPLVRWTDPSGNSVESGEGVSLSGPFVSGDTTTLRLTFSYLRTSQAGTYSCLSIIDTPTSVQRDVRDVVVQSELDHKEFTMVAIILLGFLKIHHSYLLLNYSMTLYSQVIRCPIEIN